jgi:hypothetical protein
VTRGGRGRPLPLPARYAPRPFPTATLVALVLALSLVLVFALWCHMPPPLPPLVDDVQRYGDCTVNPHGDGCGVFTD